MAKLYQPSREDLAATNADFCRQLPANRLRRRGWRCCSPLLEALATKHGPALRGFERDRGFALAARANGPGFHALVIAAALRQSESMGAFSLALFAALRLVFELFVGEEELFARGEDEI
jgi:hypothetical protein